MVSTKKKVLSAFLSLTMIGSIAASVPFVASADSTTTSDVGVSYSVHGQTYGWSQGVKSNGEEAGTEKQAKRLEAIKINLTGASLPAGAKITYKVQGQTYGWQNAKSNGEEAGTEGNAKRLEAIKITLSGMPGYEVQYEVQGQTYGWSQGWVTTQNDTAIDDAALAGTVGKAKRLEAIKIKLVKVAPDVASMSAVNTTIGVGGSTTFTFKDKDGNAVTPDDVTYSLADDSYGSINAAGKFVAQKAGKVTVNAKVGDTTVSATVNVYGVASSLVLTPASTTLVANNKSEDEVTATAVDASGFTVGNYNGTATIDMSGAAGAFTLTSAPDQDADVSGLTLTFKNGIATFKVTATASAGVTGKVALTSADIKDSFGVAVAANTSISTVLQTATSIKVTSAAKGISVNDGTATGDFTVAVEDQTGNDMLGGTYVLNAALTGAAGTLDATNATTEALVFSGATKTVTVHAAKGTVGTFTLTVTGTNLTAGSYALPAVVAGKATKFALSNTTPTYVSGDTTGGTTFAVTAVDSNGYSDAANIVVPSYKITDAKGNDVTANFTVTPAATTMKIVDKAAPGNAAGTYSLTISDTSATPLASAAATFTVTAGTCTKMTLTAAKSVVLGSNPTTTITAQAADAAGNATVAPANAFVTFGVSAAPQGNAKFNTGNYGDTYKLAFDSTGKAVVTLTMQDYDNAAYTVTATPSDLVKLGAATTTTVTVTDHPVASLALTVKDGSSSYATAGDALTTAVTMKDVNGNTMTSSSDPMTLVINHASGVSGVTATSTDKTADTATITGSLTSINDAIAAAKAAKAGVVSFVLTDNLTNATGSGSIQVSASNVASTVVVSGLASDNTLAKSATTAVTVTLVDVGGNPVVVTGSDVKITLGTTIANGISYQDANHITASTLTIKVGTSSASGYIVADSTATGTGTITFTPSTGTAYTTLTLTVK